MPQIAPARTVYEALVAGSGGNGGWRQAQDVSNVSVTGCVCYSLVREYAKKV